MPPKLTVTSHTGQPEKHAVDCHLRPPMCRRDGEGAMGNNDGNSASGDDNDDNNDDNGDGAMGSDATGYNNDDDGEGRRQRR